MFLQKENLPRKVQIVEVGPRDGLQNEKTLIRTEDKFVFIEKLIGAGLKTIEVTSFVKSESIPQMKDAADLYSMVHKKYGHSDISFPCLIPNMKGLVRALEVGVKDVALFTSTSNQFNLKNIQADIEESFQRMVPVVSEAKRSNLSLRGYVSTAFGCPYEGKIPFKKLQQVVGRFLNLGVEELSLGDTIGVATPREVQETLAGLQKSFKLKNLSMHFHDTRGMALANILVSLQMGITTFDSSAGGLGGCPYAKGATGNVATEDLLYLLNSLEIESAVAMEKLAEASTYILGLLNKETSSKYLKSYLVSQVKK